jgi:hypothetical protein
MKEVKRIAEGVAANLWYEYCCLKGKLFNESYLSSSTGNILQAIHGGLTAHVISGYQHPSLSNLMKTSGRRPEIDFVVSQYDDSLINKRARSTSKPVKQERNTSLLLTAIETKWAGSSHCTLENIIWDIIRLEMLAALNPNMTAILLLAGHSKLLKTLQTKHGLEGLLPFKAGPQELNLLPKDIVNRNGLKRVFEDNQIQALDIPKKIILTPSVSALLPTNSSKMCVIAWQINAKKNRETFIPSTIPEYTYIKKRKTP